MTKHVALVTGGARGIGLGITQSLVGAGWAVAACGVRTEAEAAPALADLGPDVHYVRADVSDRGDRTRLLGAVRERFERLDLLVNNAGIASPNSRKDPLDATEEGFDRILDINLKGPWFLTQAAARWMVEQKKADPAFRGAVISISSISAFMLSPDRADYCLTKAGLGILTKLWAVRLAEYGIPVYEIRPGIVTTDMTAPRRKKYDAMIADGKLPEGRWGTPEDIGRAVVMLARGDLTYATGQVLQVDGGLGIQQL
jgi:NAD(P)-dependent dehydrogenase (short-subunit alcohol dehydrogenase family)